MNKRLFRNLLGIFLILIGIWIGAYGLFYQELASWIKWGLASTGIFSALCGFILIISTACKEKL